MAPERRYRTLDHWRGFAALWVLVFHGYNMWLGDNPGLLPGWLTNFVLNGWLGVHVFFVISGFCIAERLAREHAARGSVMRFMADRMLRIYPPFWAALVVAILLNVAGAAAKHEPLAGPGLVPAGWEWITAFTATAHWLHQPGFLLVAWTLAYEIGFYLIAASGLWLSLRARRPWAGFVWCGVLAVLGLVPAVGASVPLLAFWPHFAIGGAVWLVQDRINRTAAQLAVGSLLIAGFCATGAAMPGDAGLHFYFTCATAWLLLVLRPWDEMIAGFGPLRWLGWAGLFSYSIYLVHAPLVGRSHTLLIRWFSPPGATAMLLQTACCLLAVGAAWVFYRTVELQTERFRRRVIPRNPRGAGTVEVAISPRRDISS